jgi:hypoxanthine phosphoribosyltransferase
VIDHLSYSTMGMRPCRELAVDMRAAIPTRSYDTMIGIGISGALVVPAMGRHLRKNWALARKSGDGSHAGDTPFEGRIGSRVLIVDDWVDSGATVAVILGKLAEAARQYGRPVPEVIGIFEYQKTRFQNMATLADESGRVSSAWSAYAQGTCAPVAPTVPVASVCDCGCED